MAAKQSTGLSERPELVRPPTIFPNETDLLKSLRNFIFVALIGNEWMIALAGRIFMTVFAGYPLR